VSEVVQLANGTHMVVRRWMPPTPMIPISDVERILIRDVHDEPAAVIREMRVGADQEYFVRIVGWAPRSEDRRLFGYARTLEMANMAVTYVDEPEVVRRSFSIERSPEWREFFLAVMVPIHVRRAPHGHWASVLEAQGERR
jgi:hypothetical protein